MCISYGLNLDIIRITKIKGGFPFYETPGAIENKWMFMERRGFELGVGGKGTRYVVSLLDTQS